MALPTRASINTAIDNLYAAFVEDKTKSQAGYGVGIMNKMIRPLRDMYRDIVDFTLTITDATDATLTVMLSATGEVGIAAGGIVAPVGTIFEVTGTGDDTADGLEGAKGSAVAAGDQFQVLTAATVSYLGLATAFDFSDEDSTDFIGL